MRTVDAVAASIDDGTAFDLDRHAEPQLAAVARQAVVVEHRGTRGVELDAADEDRAEAVDRRRAVGARAAGADAAAAADEARRGEEGEQQAEGMAAEPAEVGSQGDRRHVVCSLGRRLAPGLRAARAGASPAGAGA